MSDWSDIIVVSITSNTPPDAPTIDGPTSGNSGETYQYTVSATDVDGHLVCYRIGWDEGPTTNWSEFYPSGEDVVFSHTFLKAGTYQIRVQAMDQIGYGSEWGFLEVTMPTELGIPSLFLKFLQNHPIIYKLLQIFSEGLVDI